MLRPLRITALFALALAAGAASPVQARPDDARLLGSTRLSRAENDTDVLRPRRCPRGIESLQLRVERGQVEIEQVWVTYARGGVDRLPVRERIGEDGRSRWIDLRGGERCITSIGVVGDTERSRDQARVEIWGR
jgi:hypothetical protein